jgi:phosphoribosylformylglycinamidine synthase PurS subunit
LTSLGFVGIGSVRQGKVFDIEMTEVNRTRAERTLKAACDTLLANSVIENYHVDIE